MCELIHVSADPPARSIKLLIDEDLSPRAAVTLRDEDGIDAVAVRERGALGRPDHHVLELAFREERILVTANVADFRKLARSRELHAGIVLVEDGGLLAGEQVQLLRIAVEHIQKELVEGRDMVNRLLFIDDTGEVEFGK